MPTEREEAEDLATRYRQQYKRADGLEPSNIQDDCICGCGHVARDHNRVAGGMRGCLMAGCACSRYGHANEMRPPEPDSTCGFHKMHGCTICKCQVT